MISVLYGHDLSVTSFVRQIVGNPAVRFEGARAIGVLEGELLIAGAVFHDWNPAAGTIEMSIAAVSRRWLQRSVIAAFARYLFEGVRARLAVMRTSDKNRPACRIAEALGFTPHRIPELRGPGEAEVIYTLTAEDWQSGRFARSA